MRFQLGSTLPSFTASTVPEGWRRIHSPASRSGYLLATVAGLFTLLLIFAALTLHSFLLGFLLDPGSDHSRPPASLPVGGAVWALLFFIPVHELLHAAWHPHAGLSPRTVMVVWPARLHFGVYYDGCMTRARWLTMRLAPLFFLSVVPAFILAFFPDRIVSPAWNVFLQVMLLANCLGAGGDIVAVIYVLRQVPPSAQICFAGGKAYWHSPPSHDSLR